MWVDKANARIATLCLQAWREANVVNGKVRARHKPYTVPEFARAYVNALGIHDPVTREHEVKHLFYLESIGASTQIRDIKG
jgi:hypothetical protein